jgi:hypothetical protein
MENMKNLTLKMDNNAQIISLLSRNIEIVNKVSKFQAAVDQLHSNQKKLEDLHALISKDTTTIEKVKHDRRKELEERTMAVIRIMQVFAHDKKKSKLQSRLYHLTSEYVQNCMDMELIKISKKIWMIANKSGGYALTFVDKIKSALNPENLKATNKFEKEFGLNSAMIKNIEEASLSFIEAFLLYEVAMKEKEKVSLKIKKINKQTKKLLADKIDQFALLFEKDKPAFYNDYHELREIQLQKKVKETMNQETDFPDLLLDKDQVNQAAPKLKPRTPRKTNPKTN